METKVMDAKLNAGDGFPTMTLNLVEGGEICLPDQLDASYQIVLFFRGHF